MTCHNPHNINAVLLLDKPLGYSSNRALQTAKRLYGASKAGHAGSLDPLATGMLPICFGGALKFIEFLIGHGKRYRVTGTLGTTTTSGDKEGDILATHEYAHITPAMIADILEQFRGPQQQIPPMFSALKHEGKPLYKMARQGKVIERKPRDIIIHQLECVDYSENTFTLEVHCSSGTYIRTLVQDIAHALGSGAHVSALHRSHVAHYTPEKMVSLDQLKEADNVQDFLLPIESILEGVPKVYVSTTQCRTLLNGVCVIAEDDTPTGLFQVYDEDNRFFGIVERLEENVLKPRKLYPWDIYYPSP